jgi:rhodanese-related sulfurtransferase
MKRVPRVVVIVFIVIVAAALYYTYFLGAQKGQYGDVTVQEAKRLIEEKPNLVVLDVRTPSEYEDGHLPRAINIPVDDLLGRLDELDRSDEILVYCRTGNRSTRAVGYLNDNGFTRLGHMVDGIVAWVEAGYTLEY